MLIMCVCVGALWHNSCSSCILMVLLRLHVDGELKDLSVFAWLPVTWGFLFERQQSQGHSWHTHSSLPQLTAAWSSVLDTEKRKSVFFKTILIPLLASSLLFQAWQCNTKSVGLGYFGLYLFIIKSTPIRMWWREYSFNALPQFELFNNLAPFFYLVKWDETERSVFPTLLLLLAHCVYLPVSFHGLVCLQYMQNSLACCCVLRPSSEGHDCNHSNANMKEELTRTWEGHLENGHHSLLAGAKKKKNNSTREESTWQQ